MLLLQASIVHAMRAEVGVLTDSVANRLVLSKMARDLMSEKSMRSVDISRLLPMVVELYYVPVVEDVYATVIAASQVVNQRKDDLVNKKWSWSPALGFTRAKAPVIK
jgi:hypothetical protein